jgi:hypothetical protein
MSADNYLKGAKNLVGADCLFAKIAHPNARFVIEEVTRWNTLVNHDECGYFVDALHLELSAMRLGIVIATAGQPVIEVPASLTIDVARQLLKPRKGEKPCKTYPINGAFLALLAFVGRPALPEGVGGRGTRGRKPPAESQPPPPKQSFSVGDKVIITATKVQDVRKRNSCVLSMQVP